MADEPKNLYRYRVLRYAPNIERDEWVNIGVVLEQLGRPASDRENSEIVKSAFRLVEEQAEIARVKRLHPGADENLLRDLPAEFDSRLREPGGSAYLAKLDQVLSNVLQLSPQRALMADDFEAELDRLYHAHVAAPRGGREGIVESTRAWIKARINDAFRRRRVPKLERNIRVEEFTEQGDPLKLDYGYRNGVRGYLHAVALGRDPAQAKILAYTAGRVRAQLPGCEFTAITETEPAGDNRRHQFISQLFADEKIAIVPLLGIDRFCEELRVRLR